jgi:hypothetical protein
VPDSRSEEFHVDLDSVTGQELLVALPPVDVPPVALEAGSRLMSRRLRIRQIPEGLIWMSWGA